MDYVIAIEGNLTPFVFYNTIVNEMHDYFSTKNESNIVFDFSKVEAIDALVLPNLLCTGYWILKYRSRPAKIYIPGNLEFVPIRTFLNNTGFIRLAQLYGLFEFDADISGGLKDSEYGESLNRIEVYQITYKENTNGEIDVKQTRSNAWERLKKTFVPFIDEFLKYSTDQYVLKNKLQISRSLLSFNRELIENSLLHGQSFCFVAMQYTSSYRKQIKLSIADCGVGFRKCLNLERSRSLEIQDLKQKMETCTYDKERAAIQLQIQEIQDECYPLRDEDIIRLAQQPHLETELEGIVYGLLSRKSKPYGLYNIHRIIRAMGGTIRIHSNDTQLILSERTGLLLEVCGGSEQLISVLESEQYRSNIRTGLRFRGTHIEMDIMLEEPKEG